MPNIRIRVGASLDQDAAAIFRPVIDQARRARQAISNDSKRGVRDDARTQMEIQKEIYRQQSQLNREAMRAKIDADKEALRTASDAARERIRQRTQLELEAIRQRGAAERQEAQLAFQRQKELARQLDRETSGRTGRGGGGRIGRGPGETPIIRNIVQNSGRNLAVLARGAEGIAAQIAAGAGVDFNLGSAVHRNVERESLAVALAQSGFQEHATPGTPAATRVDPQALQNEAFTIAQKTAFDPTDILKAGRAFVGVTGDLDQARKLMQGLATISKATDSNIEDVARAAAKVNATLEDTPDKAEKTLAITRLLAGQGKLGAMEMRDYAKAVGVIAGTAGGFAGDRTENIAELSAMAQQSVQSGFSKGPLQAATGIASFRNTLLKPARVKAFAKTFGVGQQRMAKMLSEMTPEQLVVESIRRSKGNALTMASMFADTRGHSVVLPYEQIFRQATGGKTDKESVEKGVKAIEDAFDHLKKGAMTEAEANREAARQMESTKDKAQLFQNELDKLALEIQGKLQPTLERLAPKILEAVRGFGTFVEWAMDNPGKLITAAIVGSIGKAAIGEAVAVSIQRLISGGGGGGTGGVGGKAGGVLGAVGLGGAIGTAVAGYITEEGILGHDKNNKQLGDLTSRLAAMPDDERKKALPGAIREFKTIEENRSFLDKAAGFSDAEFKGAASFLESEARRLGLMAGAQGSTADREHIDKLEGIRQLLAQPLKVEFSGAPPEWRPPMLDTRPVTSDVPGRK